LGIWRGGNGRVWRGRERWEGKDGKVEIGVERGEWKGRERRGRARLGCLFRAREFLVTPLLVRTEFL